MQDVAVCDDVLLAFDAVLPRIPRRGHAAALDQVVVRDRLGLEGVNWGSLIGVPLYLQGWAPAPGANPAGVIVSNGIEWFIGNI